MRRLKAVCFPLGKQLFSPGHDPIEQSEKVIQRVLIFLNQYRTAVGHDVKRLQHPAGIIQYVELHLAGRIVLAEGIQDTLYHGRLTAATLSDNHQILTVFKIKKQRKLLLPGRVIQPSQISLHRSFRHLTLPRNIQPVRQRILP